MVMPGIHGNEFVTYPLAEVLTKVELPEDLTVSIVPSVNPDD